MNHILWYLISLIFLSVTHLNHQYYLIPTVDVCILPKETGPCFEYEQKWYHNAQEGYCQQFWFGGCDGNDNMFDSKEACEYQCVKNNEEEINNVVPGAHMTAQVTKPAPYVSGMVPS